MMDTQQRAAPALAAPGCTSAGQGGAAVPALQRFASHDPDSPLHSMLLGQPPSARGLHMQIHTQVSLPQQGLASPSALSVKSIFTGEAGWFRGLLG